jgi:hypothetical protein
MEAKVSGWISNPMSALMSDWQGELWKLLPLLTAFSVVFVGSWLTGRAKRREWIADNQKEEYRKVLASLTRLNMILVDRHFTGTMDLQETKRAMEETSLAFNTSLFISDFLAETKVGGDVLDASKAFISGGSFDEYHEKYWKAVNLILSSAKKIKI